MCVCVCVHSTTCVTVLSLSLPSLPFTHFPQKLLELEELDTPQAIEAAPSSSPSSPSSPSSSLSSPTVKMDSVSLSWSADGEKKVLNDISFTVDQVSGQLAQHPLNCALTDSPSLPGAAAAGGGGTSRSWEGTPLASAATVGYHLLRSSSLPYLPPSAFSPFLLSPLPPSLCLLSVPPLSLTSLPLPSLRSFSLPYLPPSAFCPFLLSPLPPSLCLLSIPSLSLTSLPLPSLLLSPLPPSLCLPSSSLPHLPPSAFPPPLSLTSLPLPSVPSFSLYTVYTTSVSARRTKACRRIGGGQRSSFLCPPRALGILGDSERQHSTRPAL